MKISNNALNFLLAQYRAIFKRAYAKGLATAVLMTAGLAATQAQAAAYSGGFASWDEASDSVTIDTSNADGVDATKRFFNDLVIASGGSLTINNTNGAHNTAVNVKNQLTVNSGGTLTVSGGALAGAYTLSADDQSNLEDHNTGDLLVKSGGKFNLSGGWVQMDQVTFETGSTITLSGAEASKWSDTAMVYGNNVTVAKDAKVTLTNAQLSTTTDGLLQINGEVTLNSGSFIRATDNFLSGEYDPSYNSGRIVLGEGAKITATNGSTGGIVGQDIEIQSGAEVTVGSGATFTLGGDFTDSAVVGSAQTGASSVLLNGTLTIDENATSFKLGGTNDLDGEKATTTLVVENGTLTNNASTSVSIDGTIEVKDTGTINGSGSMELTENGGLTMSSEKMGEFVKTGKVDASSGTLTFTDAVDLSDITFFNTDGNAGIKIASGTTFAGDNVTITGALKDSSGKALAGYHGELEQDDVELGSNDYVDDFNVKTVTAHNSLDFQAKDDFTAKGTAFTLDRPYYVLDETTQQPVKDACGNNIENTVGRVTGDKLVLSQDVGNSAQAVLKAISGKWVVDNDIEVSGGRIAAIASSATSPVYLTLEGDLTFTSTSGSFFVRANGSQSTLDLSKADSITYANGDTGNGQKPLYLNAINGGVLVMTGEQVEQVLTDTVNKIGIKIGNSSTLQVTDDDLDMTFAQFSSGNDAHTITFGNGNNKVEVAGTLSLTTGEEQKDTSTALTLGSNTVQADALVLKNLDSALNSGNYVTEADVAVKDGTLVALSNLTVVNANLLLGSGGTATLTLGDAAATALKTGTVNAQSITVDSGSTVEAYGAWSQDGIMKVTSGTFTVNGSYQGTELSLADSGAASFTGYYQGVEGTSSFTRVSAAAAQSLTVSSGTLRIEGENVPGQGTAENKTNPYGVALADKAIVVSDDATLAFGNYASDNAFTVSGDKVTMSTGFGDIDLQGGTVELNFKDNFTTGLSSKALVSLKKEWLGGSGDNGALNGWLDIGATTISDLKNILTPSADGTYYSVTQEKYAPIVDVLSNVKNEQVENLLLTEVKTGVKGVYGALQSAANNKTITVTDDTVLSNAGINGGAFATVGATSELAALKVESSKLTLDSDKSAGTAGAIDLDNGSSLRLTGTNAITVAEITGQGAITASAATTVQGGLKGDSLAAYSDVVVSGDVVIQDDGITNYNNDTVTGGTVTAANVDVKGSAKFVGGALTAQDITLGAGGDFTHDAVLTATGKLTLGNDLFLGQATEQSNCPNIPDKEGSAGFMDAYELDLNGHDIYLDPDYDQQASVGATQYFKTRIQSDEYDGGTADGSLYIGQNSAFGIGASLAETQAALAALKLTDSTGALTQGTGAVLYVNRGFTLDEDNKIVLDASATRSDLQSSQHTAKKGNYVAYVGAEAGMVITDHAFGQDMTDTAITFKAQGAQVYAEDGAKILLAGQKFSTSQPLSIFKDGDNDGVDIVNTKSADGWGTIIVQTENGLLYDELHGQNAGSVNLELAPNSRAILSGASNPVYEAIIQYARGDLDGDATTNDPVVGEGYTPDSLKAYEASNPRDPSLLVPNEADNALLTATVNSGNGQGAESAARLALYGGAVQAALTSAQSSSEVIAARMGIGAQGADLTAADNGIGGGLWVAPIYKSVDSDGFEAQGVDYGTDLNLYGVSLGADFAVLPEARIGVMFNVGSGDADGQGIASSVSNDFDYWGVGLYAGYSFGNVTVVGDIGYSTVDNDVTAASGLADIGELSSSMDASVFTVGVTGQYALDVAGFGIKPHVGLRYSNLDLDDYSVNSAVAGEVAGYEADSLSIFSIPVGVTISKDIIAGSWLVKPSFDLTLTGQFGDDEAEGTVGWTGVANLDKNLTTEVFDNFTYGANLGLAAQSGNFSLGLGLGYTGSSNTDEFSASANARFTF